MSDATVKTSSASATAPNTTPAHVSSIINHHMKQHIDAATTAAAMAAGVPFFYLSIIDATTRADGTGAVTSNGKGMFVGPLKTYTAPERDMVAAQFKDIPDLRRRLDNPDAEVVLISRVIVNGATHSSITGIGIRDVLVATGK